MAREADDGTDLSPSVSVRAGLRPYVCDSIETAICSFILGDFVGVILG